MKFPWHKYIEIPTNRRNTLQIFLTNACNLRCNGCFARNVMGEDKKNLDPKEFMDVVQEFRKRGGKQINILGGEPMLHPHIDEILWYLDFIHPNNIISSPLTTTVYTNGLLLHKLKEYQIKNCSFKNIKFRVSLYCKSGNIKSAESLPKTDIPIDVCFMVSKTTTVDELLGSASHIENNFNCKVFFISSIRELDNPNQEFFEDTNLTMPVMEYKKLVYDFLSRYEGNMDIHVSKRGVFESTLSVADNKCRFANYFEGGRIIQCPYDIVNLKFQNDYEFGERYCQHNNSCLMSKVIYRKKQK